MRSKSFSDRWSPSDRGSHSDRGEPGRRGGFLALALLLAVAGPSRAEPGEDSLAVFPAKFELNGPQARQRLLVESTAPFGSKLGPKRLAVGQVTEGVTFATSDPAVVRIEDGHAVAAGNGTAVVTAAAGGRIASAEVTVRGVDAPFRWSFRVHVQSVLTKAGCNSGACHGAAAGKNGFKLSLRGYDPVGDHSVLTRHARGRRVNLSDPARSLLVMKPTLAAPHKGGQRVEVDSIEYRVLSEWVAAGAPPPSPDDATVDRLEVFPPQAVLKPGAAEQLSVRAFFSDGRSEEVTRWVLFTATDGAVAQVDERGRVQVMGHGESAITAWYQSRIVVATITAPFAQEVPAENFAPIFASATPRNFIDEHVLAKLQSLNLPPSPPAGDSEFLRRAFLDTIGVLPTADETRAFLSDPSPQKRDKLIEMLLGRPEFVDYWAYKWSDLFLVSSEKLRPPAMWAYYDWIRRQVAANAPWDRMARAIVTSQGSTLENGAANFFTLHQDPQSMAETVSQAFLAMSIGCARCHNHPLEKWTNDQYYGMANIFARLRVKEAPGDGNGVVFTAASGDLVQPLTGKPQPPRPLDGESVAFDAPEDRRIRLADWLTSPSNPYFSRAAANRVWANFMGVGLVEKVDDLRATNPASNEVLLSALARHLAESGFDLKVLMRSILQSAAYQRSSRVLPENRGDRRFYSRYYPKRLMAEVLLDGLSQATGAPTAFGGYPAGWRAMQLPDANVASYFLKSFGRPERLITCECERNAEPSMAQVLHISNGDTINQKLEAKGNRIEKLIAAGKTDDEIVDEAYLWALCRLPAADEKRKVLEVLAGAGKDARRPAIEDLFWGLLSSKEFIFNS